MNKRSKAYRNKIAALAKARAALKKKRAAAKRNDRALTPAIKKVAGDWILATYKHEAGETMPPKTVRERVRAIIEDELARLLG